MSAPAPSWDAPLIDPALLEYATPEELVAYEEALQLQLSVQSPLNYALRVSPSTEDYPHQRLLDQYIVALIEHRLYPAPTGIGPPAVLAEDGEYRHPETGQAACQWLCVSMPPRHGKSYLVSEHTPAWYLIRYPDHRVILTSYEATFAASWGRRAREHINNHPEYGISVATDSRAADDWNLADQRGGMNTAGAGGPITGKGAHLMIVDDPIKNADEALSATYRTKLGNWMTSTVETRLEPGGVGILMATRWHEDDLIGRMTKEDNGEWFYLNLPALAFESCDEHGVSVDPETSSPDPLGRAPGEALCPDRYNVARLAVIREKGDGDASNGLSGQYWFNAMYQGRPSVEGGGIIAKPFFYYASIRRGDSLTWSLTRPNGVVEHINPNVCRWYATMDVAASVKTQADWTVFSVWAKTPNGDLLLVDRHRKRLETPDLREQTVNWYREYPLLTFVGVENKTFGMSLIQELVRTPGVVVRPLEADTDKMTRAIPAGAAIAGGRIYFPANATWLDEWETELVKFPNATHDDQVDTLAYAWLEAARLPSMPAPAKQPVTMEEKVRAHLNKLSSKRKVKVGAPQGRW